MSLVLSIRKRKKELIDIGFAFGLSKDWKFCFWTVSPFREARTLDIEVLFLVNQLKSKVYAQGYVDKSGTAQFDFFGFYYPNSKNPIMKGRTPILGEEIKIISSSADYITFV